MKIKKNRKKEDIKRPRGRQEDQVSGGVETRPTEKDREGGRNVEG